MTKIAIISGMPIGPMITDCRLYDSPMKVRLPVCLLILCGGLLAAPNQPVVPPFAQPSANFDAATATQAWLNMVPAAAKARSDAYFEGTEWLTLWNYVVPAAIFAILILTGWSARLRDWPERRFRWPWLQRSAYWLHFFVLLTLLDLPLTLYEGFYRERQYGLMNQTLLQWLGDQAIGFALALLFGGLAFLLFMTVLRRLPRTWHFWGVLLTILLSVVSIALEPVYIAPLFNTYTPLPASPLKRDILALARANGIQARDVFEENASKQSNRVSAYVAGIGATERIVLNDNLLRRVSPQGVMSVMGHEMGHYVMHHILNTLLFLGILIALFFAVLRWSLEASLARWGQRWRIRSVSDSAVLPLALLIIVTLDFVATPVENTWTRTEEAEADLYGLNAARQPDGEAEVDLLLGEYRKLDPGPLEELLFYDHPAGRARIFMAMRWKQENLCLFDSKLPCPSPPAK